MTRIEKMLADYERDHQHPMNKATHMVGIPMILLSLPLIFFVPPVGIGLFVLGWILQFIGHAFEGKPPSFFRDPTFLLVGATWYGKRLWSKLIGQPFDEPAPA
ncbi:MAG: permease [Sandaracinus sp.]|nr:permease [Sandaracinus sp.]|tara:strand:+ start:1090 stop:1398 length:309 start_codon:yes stop_codon:yes gene_type:complete